ncbi:TPA: hypothetical protein QDB02_005888 [Burkholderia vietnamiensis]|nr:hypothetical protein C2U71_12030 [Burkholderia ubonensis]HDR9058088.1 hypothetical protein [Burkholderia vietnamiensis]
MSFSILSSLESIATSIITGFYSGLVVAKKCDFNSLREEAVRAVVPGGTAKEDAFALDAMALSFERRGHRKAATQLREIAKGFHNISKNAVSVEELDLMTARHLIDQRNRLRSELLSLKPSLLILAWPF